MQSEFKRLYRSKTNRVFAGVCGGIGEYAEVDPVLIRLLVVILILSSAVFPGLLLYLLAILIIPDQP